MELSSLLSKKNQKLAVSASDPLKFTNTFIAIKIIILKPLAVVAISFMASAVPQPCDVQATPMLKRAPSTGTPLAKKYVELRLKLSMAEPGCRQMHWMQAKFMTIS